MAELQLFGSDRTRFALIARKRLIRDGVVAALGFGVALWACTGSGYEVVSKGFMLLMAGVPIYVDMRWWVARDTAAVQTPLDHS